MPRKTPRTKEQEQRYRLKQKERYHNDPEFRARCIANAKQNYLKNRKKRIAYVTKWRKERMNDPIFREKRRIRIADWRRRNPEKCALYVDLEHDRKRSREYRISHPEKRKQACDNYRKNNRETVAAYNREYNRNHPEECAIRQHNRRARIKGNGGKLSSSIIETLFAEQNGQCSYCFIDLNESGLHLDHVIPVVLGGKNDDSNIQLLCPSCNHRKSAKHPLDYMREKGIFPSTLIDKISSTLKLKRVA